MQALVKQNIIFRFSYDPSFHQVSKPRSVVTLGKNLIGIEFRHLSAPIRLLFQTYSSTHFNEFIIQILHNFLLPCIPSFKRLSSHSDIRRWYSFAVVLAAVYALDI